MHDYLQRKIILGCGLTPFAYHRIVEQIELFFGWNTLDIGVLKIEWYFVVMFIEFKMNSQWLG